MKQFVATIFLLFSLVLTETVLGQQNVIPGVNLYLAGKNSEAIDSLSQAVKQKDFEANGEVWNYLGLAYAKDNNFKKAAKALEKAVELRPDKSAYHSNLAYVYVLSRQTSKARNQSKKAIDLDPKNITAIYVKGLADFFEQKLDDAEKESDQVIVIDPTYPQAYVLKSNILVMKLGLKVAKGSPVKEHIEFLKDATDVLKTGVEKCKDSPNHKLVDEEFETVSAFYKFFSTDKKMATDPNAAPEPGITPLKLISKPHPGYTDSARQANVQGTITLALIFGADGKVQHVLPLKRLGNGLEEQAVSAARKIQFEPEEKDEKKISVVKVIEYTFSIY